MFKVGDKVEILEYGEWTGPYTVVQLEGRTKDHLVLKSGHNVFEHYNDEYRGVSYNTRLYNV